MGEPQRGWGGDKPDMGEPQEGRGNKCDMSEPRGWGGGG